MTEWHPDDDGLFDLALGEIPEPEQETTLRHLSSCSHCRLEYDAISAAIDQTLSAAPRMQPPPGFDRAVLDAMGLGGGTPVHTPADTPAHTPVGTPVGTPVDTRIRTHRATSTDSAASARTGRRPLLLAAAAAVAGLLIGIGATVAIGVFGDDPSITAAPERHVPLSTSDGERVGTVAQSWFDGEQVLVVDVTAGRPGKHYACRLQLANGQDRVVGDWTLESDDGATWVVPVPEAEVEAVELVADNGKVWSSAPL